MTRAALTVLSADRGRPFALFVAAGDVDLALHKNNLDNAIGAVYSGEDAVDAVIKWVEQHSNWDESAMVVASALATTWSSTTSAPWPGQPRGETAHERGGSAVRSDQNASAETTSPGSRLGSDQEPPGVRPGN
jgi:alkaline phosphatase